jgi:hypothetical protein
MLTLRGKHDSNQSSLNHLTSSPAKLPENAARLCPTRGKTPRAAHFGSKSRPLVVVDGEDLCWTNMAETPQPAPNLIAKFRGMKLSEQ